MEELKKVFIEAGMDYEMFLSMATAEERAKMGEITEAMKFSQENIEAIKGIKEEVNLLLSAESWCPYVRATIPVIEMMTELNPKIRLRIVTEGRGVMFMAEPMKLRVDRYVVPTMAIMDKDFKYLGKYRGRPRIYRGLNFEDIEDEFFAGLRTNDILDEVIGVILGK